MFTLPHPARRSPCAFAHREVLASTAYASLGTCYVLLKASTLDNVQAHLGQRMRCQSAKRYRGCIPCLPDAVG